MSSPGFPDTSEPVLRRKMKTGMWEAGIFCTSLAHWVWISFPARTSTAARKLAPDMFALLYSESAERWEQAAARANAEAKRLSILAANTRASESR